MEFDIIRDRPWLEAQLSGAGTNDATLTDELARLAHDSPEPIRSHSDNYITPEELRRHRYARDVSRTTFRALNAFFKYNIHREDVRIADRTLAFFDDDDAILTLTTTGTAKNARDFRADVIVESNASGATHEITTDIVTQAESVMAFFTRYDETTHSFILKETPIDLAAARRALSNGTAASPRYADDAAQRLAWQNLNPANGIKMASLAAFYRFALSSKNPESPWVDACDFGEIRGMTDGSEIEKKFAAAMLTAVVMDAESSADTAKDEICSLAIIHACHIINATNGTYGIGILQHLSQSQWERVLDDPDNAVAVAASIAHALAIETPRRNHDLIGVRGRDLQSQLFDTLTDDTANNTASFRVVVAAAFLIAHKNDPEFFATSPQAGGISFGDALFQRLETLNHSDNAYFSHAALINLILSALGQVANAAPRRAPIRQRAFTWCREFYSRFTTFVDPSAPETVRARQKNDDRTILLKTQRVLSALDPEAAAGLFFDESFSNLDAAFDPRVQKYLAHNSYHRRIGNARQTALVTGKERLATKRELDEENNEWGRVAEKAIRDNEIFRLEFLKQAYAASDPEKTAAVKDALKRFDPQGILARNLAFAHVLRCLYARRETFDPAALPIDTLNHAYIDSLDFAAFMRERIPTAVYEHEAKEFDAWIIELKRDNPEFFDGLLRAFHSLPESQRQLPIDILFLEVNEVEWWQYFVDPDQAPLLMMDFVGPIRSWTSGYHGRVLTRLRAFFDQDTIRRERVTHPDAYKKPEAYWPDYAPTMTRERFETSILPILNAGESPTGSPEFALPAEEALHLLSYFKSTGFAAYLPCWLVFIIEHEFFEDDRIGENFTPMQHAFELLADAKLPHDRLEALFRERGYLNVPKSSTDSRRQTAVRKAALDCLKKSPTRQKARLRYEERDPASVRERIRRAGHADISLLPKTYAELKDSFTRKTLTPGDYLDYRREARDLLKTHRLDAIRTILDEALSDKELVYPDNAPLTPLFPGLLGQFVTNNLLDKSLFAIATTGAATGGGLASLVDFSRIMLKWGRRNNVDLTQVFIDAFTSYKVPPSIAALQSEVSACRELIAELDRKIALIKANNSIAATFPTLFIDSEANGTPDLDALESQLRDAQTNLIALESARDGAVVALSQQPELVSQQALFQIITSIYNAIRRQYLKEALIAAGEETGRLVASYLEEELIPQKRSLLAEGNDPQALHDVTQKIEFLTDVLAQMES